LVAAPLVTDTFLKVVRCNIQERVAGVVVLEDDAVAAALIVLVAVTPERCRDEVRRRRGGLGDPPTLATGAN